MMEDNDDLENDSHSSDNASDSADFLPSVRFSDASRAYLH